MLNGCFGSKPSDRLGVLLPNSHGMCYVSQNKKKVVNGAVIPDLLTLWKDANPDIPILKEAKAEYAILQ